MNFADFEIIQKVKKLATAIHREQRELAKQEKTLADNQALAQRLGLNKNAEAEAAVNSLRDKIGKMRAEHNKLSTRAVSGWRCSPITKGR